MSQPAPFRFLHSTQRVVFGANAFQDLGAVAEEFGCRKAAVLLDGAFADGPVQERAADLLKPQAPAFHALPAREPDSDSVVAAHGFLEAVNPDLVVAIGGGTAIDTGKVARMLLSNPGPLDNIAGPVGVNMHPHGSLFVCIPTTAGTGSEVSDSAIVAASGTTYKQIFRSPEMSAKIAILDPELCVSAPARVTAASGYDAITHAVEAYTSRMSSPVSDPLALAAMGLLARALPVSFRDPGNIAARGDCLTGSMLAAMAFNSANLGLAHAISGALGALHHVPHGLANALALPWTMAFNQPELGEKGKNIAKIFGGESASEGLSAIRKTLELDRSLDEFVKSEGERDALAQAAMASGQIKMNPRPSTRHDVRIIIEAMRTPTGGGQPHLNL